jgi:hypothetical protein
VAPIPLLLGEVEQLVLLAVLRLGDEAYAVPIRALIEQDAGATLSRGTGEINPNLSGTTTWGEYERQIGPPLNPVWINPDVSGYGPYFMAGVMLHEWGHQRGYGHVPNSCGTQSIMKEYRDYGEELPYEIGPGDIAATERDVPPG